MAKEEPMAEEKSPIKIKKIGHVVLSVSDIERSSKFWTEIMGFKFSTATKSA
jgi:catechol-2,3-dioxygenase